MLAQFGALVTAAQVALEPHLADMTTMQWIQLSGIAVISWLGVNGITRGDLRHG